MEIADHMTLLFPVTIPSRRQPKIKILIGMRDMHSLCRALVLQKEGVSIAPATNAGDGSPSVTASSPYALYASQRAGTVHTRLGVVGVDLLRAMYGALRWSLA